jgi:hypothetical protein
MIEPDRLIEIAGILMKDRFDRGQEDKEAGDAVERLESISERTGISVEELREAKNGFSNLAMILRGNS